MRELAAKLTALHEKHFGVRPAVIAWAPGRAEVLGNHTDYNGGCVLSAAIDRGHCFAISPGREPGFRLLAGDLETVTRFDTATISPVDGAPWAGYVKGVFYYLKERGVPADSWDCSFLGNIPVGSGLSSSAALEVSAATAAGALTGITLDPVDIARLCREAEFRFAGCNCGLLDQMSSLFGREEHLLKTDFRDLSVSCVPTPPELRFLMVTPAVTHTLTESPYNRRRESCLQAVRELAPFLNREPASLREITPGEFEQFRGRIDPEAARRAAHVIGEMERVEQGAAALASGDITRFGELMYLSHESSRSNFENSAPELDRIIEAARSAGAPGARLSGGGWGGSLIVLTRAAEEQNLTDNLIRFCTDGGLNVRITPLKPSGGAKVLQASS